MFHSQRVGVKNLDAAGYAAHQGCNQLLALGCFSTDGGAVPREDDVVFFIAPHILCSHVIAVVRFLSLVAGIIFIGKEIDDKLANEVIGVLQSPQALHSSLSWATMGSRPWGILRLYLDSEAGMQRQHRQQCCDMMPGQQQAHLLVHQ